MKGRVSWLAFLIAVGVIAGVQASQNSSSDQTIRLRFPEGADLTGLWVNYFLRGPFGGYGGSGRLDPAMREYVIETSREGRPATTFEAVVYLPGYRFVVLPRTPLEGRRADFSRIELLPLASLQLSGEIILARPVKGLTIQVGYYADWECIFFELIDCMLGRIVVAESQIAEDGTFTLQIPDFMRDPTVASFGTRRGRFSLILRDKATGNEPYLLEEVRSRGRWFEMPVAAEYPQDLQLVLVPRP